MTPRERLEAAGWTAAMRGTIWLPPKGAGWITEAQALAQLARDEAKETSDARIRSGNGTADSGAVCGGVDNSGAAGNRSVGASEVPNAPSGANVAPIATSVSAPDLTRWDADFSKEPYMKIAKNGKWVRYTDVREYASSFSAATEYWQRIFADMAAGRASDIEQFTVRAEAAETKELEARQPVVLVLRELRAAEAKVTELQARIDNDHRDETIIALNESHKHWVERAQKAEDSRDRLQVALRITQRTVCGNWAGGFTILVTGVEIDAIRVALGDPDPDAYSLQISVSQKNARCVRIMP